MAQHQRGPTHPSGTSGSDTSRGAVGVQTPASPLTANPGSADARPVRTAPASVLSAARTETASPAVGLPPARPLLAQVWAIQQALNTIIVGPLEPIPHALLALCAAQPLFLLAPF